METSDLFGGTVRTDADDLMAILWLTPGWPRDEIRDREFCGELLRKFPNKDLAEELDRWRVWLLDQADREEMMKGNVRSRVRNWCAKRFINQGSSRRQAGSRTGRTSTRPRPASAFDGYSPGLNRW